MPRKGAVKGIQKTVELNAVMQKRLASIKEFLAFNSDSEVMRFLINDYYIKNKLKESKEEV